jgi:hypothetical protein
MIDDGEDCRVRADADGKSKNRRGRKSGAAAEGARRIPEILCRFIEQAQAESLPARFFERLQGSELSSRPKFGRNGRHSGADEIRCVTLAMKPELRIHLRFHAAAAEGAFEK